MPTVSIIVPVYKVEKYLTSCIESILSQTYADFELLLIDDGSPDNCPQICDRFAESDSRVRVVHQNNSGVSVARNVGLDVAKGDFISFIDSDDYIDSNMIKTMLETIVSTGADVVVCGIDHFSEEGEFLFTELRTQGEHHQQDLLKTLFEMPNILGGCIYNKMYKRDVLADTRFTPGMIMAEDRYFLLEYYGKCRKGIKIEDAFCKVTDRSNSASRDSNINIPCKMIEGSYALLTKSKEYSDELYKLAVEKFLDDCVWHITKIVKIGKECKLPYRKKQWQYLFFMFRILIESFFQGYLSKKAKNRYAMEWLSLIRG